MQRGVRRTLLIASYRNGRGRTIEENENQQWPEIKQVVQTKFPEKLAVEGVMNELQSPTIGNGDYIIFPRAMTEPVG